MTRKIVFFDGDCGFCNRSVMWILNRDKKQRFLFASLQSIHAEQELGSSGLLPNFATLNTMVLLDGQTIHIRSAAVLQIARMLGFPYSLSAVFLIVPAKLRDMIYNLIANNRQRFTDNKHECVLLTPEQRKRFL